MTLIPWREIALVALHFTVPPTVLESVRSGVEILSYAGFLHDTSVYNHLDTVHALITDYKCPPECTDFTGLAPLHAAAHGGHVETVRLLITEFGCNKMATDLAGRTPLHTAVSNGQNSILNLLVTEFSCPGLP